MFRSRTVTRSIASSRRDNEFNITSLDLSDYVGDDGLLDLSGTLRRTSVLTLRPDLDSSQLRPSFPLFHPLCQPPTSRQWEPAIAAPKYLITQPIAHHG